MTRLWLETGYLFFGPVMSLNCVSTFQSRFPALGACRDLVLSADLL